MPSLKHTLPATIVLLLALIVAACGSSTGSSSTGSTGSTTSATPAPSPTAIPSPSPTPSPAPAANILVHTAQATVGGASKTILTNDQGLTLYYFTADSSSTSACTGGCASVWPPLLLTGSGAPASAAALSGKLITQMTANGNQIEYNGHLLYTYSGDTAPGQTHGEGLFGKWFVATTSLA